MKTETAGAPVQSREEEALARHRDALRNRFPLPTPTPRKKAKAASAAALMILLGAGLVWLDPAYYSEQYRTANDAQQQVQLTDGSRLTLDRNTQLSVAWHIRSRRINLEQGQAMFDIAKTIVRPLQVTAGEARVHVLGTLFSVAKFNPNVRVTLLRGSVEVNTGNDAEHRVTLRPNQQIDVRDNQLQQVVTVDVDAASAWQNNRLVFDHTPLTEVLILIQRYYPQPIILDDPSLNNLTLSGVFDTRNIDDLLSALPDVLPLALNTSADGAIHVTHKAQ